MIRIIINLTLSATTSLGLLVSVGTIRHALAEQSCSDITASATIDDAYKVVPEPVRTSDKSPKNVQLNDVIAVKIANLEKLYDTACKNKSIVLFLNGFPIKSLTPYPPTDPKGDGLLKFVLSRTDESRKAWTTILGKPDFQPRNIEVSVGFEDQFPLKGTAGKLPLLKLDILPKRWSAIILTIIFCLMLYIFGRCVFSTNIIRDGNLGAVGAAGALGTYSLSKFQGALWFFIILAAYLIIGFVTGDFVDSINSTAVILLGIGAGTVLGSAVIDKSKSTPETEKAEHEKIIETKIKLDQLDAELAALDTQLDASSPPTNVVGLAQQRKDKGAAREELFGFYRKLTGQSENFLKDILSDANGISFHRFQMAAWTLFLCVVFIKEVYYNLAMPTFDATLMGLLGLSAGTYLGLKIPEAKSAKQ